MSRGYTSIRKKSSYKNKRRRTSLSANNWWPLLKLLIIIVVMLAVLGALIYLVLPKVLPYVGVEFYPPGVARPTPTPEPTPEPTPNPLLESNDLSYLHEEIVVIQSQYKWFGDPYYYDNNILFTAGETVNGATRMTTLFIHNTEADSNALTKLSIELQNDHFLYPVINDSWLVYLDAHADGGGNIMVYKRNGMQFTDPRIVKEVYTGQPQLFIWNNYLAWTERTGTNMDKLFLCDLNTLESVTVQMFERSYFGTSMPYLRNGLLVWADVDAETSSQITSRIHTLDVEAGTSKEYIFGMYVHDPKTDGEYLAWMDGNHDPVTKLYIADISGDQAEPVVIDEGVVDYFFGNGYLAYSKDEKVWIYLFSEGKSFSLTRNIELAQLLNANDDVVMWMDVTSRDRDVVKYARIPK